jgi:dTDP-4-dehydrorhamnose 3,5-epimerase
MNFIETEIEGLFVIKPTTIEDNRGWFMRTYSEDIFQKNIQNFPEKWIQMNHSFSREINTWRGFHFQIPPFQETKLVRCVSGGIIDFVIDLRKNSKTFLKNYKIELSAKNQKMIYIPKGFAHGFITLETNTELIYLHDQYYNPEYESGIRFDDPFLQIDLGIQPEHVSQRDLTHKLLSNNFKGF